jgi:hypothetical protein
MKNEGFCQRKMCFQKLIFSVTFTLMSSALQFFGMPLIHNFRLSTDGVTPKNRLGLKPTKKRRPRNWGAAVALWKSDEEKIKSLIGNS